MPVFQAGWKPDDVAWLHVFYGLPFALHPAVSGYDDQRLAERVRVPCGAGTGLKCDGRCRDACRFRSRMQGVNANLASEPCIGPFLRWLNSIPLNLH